VRVRLKEYKAAGYLKKRMMMMAFQFVRISNLFFVT
jgi:hypothetical protein